MGAGTILGTFKDHFRNMCTYFYYFLYVFHEIRYQPDINLKYVSKHVLRRTSYQDIIYGTIDDPMVNERDRIYIYICIYDR